MRKHLSVIMLILRCFVYKLLLIMLCMAAAEAAIIFFMPEAKMQLLFDLIDSSRVNFVYTAAAALLMISLIGVCSFGNSHPRYTLARLSVSERTVMFWHWLCGALSFLILWLWQIVLLYAIAIWHIGAAEPGYVSHQSIYLATFRSTFIHSILPLDDVSRFLRNIVIALCMGGSCATGAYKLRRDKKGVFAPTFLIALFAGTYSAEHFEVSYDGFLMFAFALVLVISLVGVFTGDAEVDYEEASLEN